MATRLREYAQSVHSWWCRLLPSTTDSILYFASAVFAILIALNSSSPAQWHWGYLAFVPFLIASMASMAGPQRSSSAIRQWRIGVLALTFVGVMVIPLALEIQWRPSQPATVAQPEVPVIERSGLNLAHGKSPYVARVDAHGHVINALKDRPAFESFFPYFPLMGIFGLPSAASGELHGFSDARIAMTIFTVLMMMMALIMLRAPPDRKIRVAQILVVLPTGSLFLATGGDDMPILALCLVALVTMQRHRGLATGFVLGVAGAMKLTAWPFALAVLAVTRNREGRRDWPRVLAVMASVLVVSILPFAIRGPSAFIANVVAFPLGLSGVPSPAATPLPGHLITNWFPALRHVVLPLVFVVGGALLAKWLKSHWPIDLPSALRLLAVVMTTVICAASATRIGYVIYPINFLLWAWVFTPVEAPSGERVVLVEAQRPGSRVAV